MSQQQQQQMSAIDAFQAHYPGLLDDLGRPDYPRIHETIVSWDNQLWQQGIRFDGRANVDLILGFLRNQLAGVVSEKNLNIAACSTWAALKFQPGYEMADPRATEKAQAAAEKEQAEIEKRERERQWRNANPVLKDPRRDIQEAREARAAEEAARLAEARDVNSEVFKKNQAEAKSKFDDICSRYIHPGRNHAISQDRRNGLKSLDKAVTAGKDKDGKVVYLHTSVDPNHLGILELAKAALRGFEIEDSKVRW